MWKWRGTPLDKLTNVELEDAMTQTLNILCAIHRELQGRRSKYRDEMDRQTNETLLARPMRPLR